MGYSGIWTLAEVENNQIKAVSYELLSRGRKLCQKLDTELTSILMGNNINREQARKLIYRGADRVIFINSCIFKDFIVENYSKALQKLVKEKKPEIILAAATTTGRTLMPHLAVQVETGLTADCTELDIEEDTGNLLQIRPAIGGNVLATIKTPADRPQMATVRPGSSKISAADKTRTGEIIEYELSQFFKDARVQKLDFRKISENEVNLQDAEIIVAGGKGLKKPENFEMIRKLADLLGGAVGASREAVDREWISYPHQIGLSGKTVTPKLYIAIGISGAIQHLAGMKTSDYIIAINEDPEANIFKVADLGLVGDLFEIVPEINQKLENEEVLNFGI